MQEKAEIQGKISCTVQKIVAAKQAHFFILVQLKSSNSSQQKTSTKFRTQTSVLTNRPQLLRNYFTFHIDSNPHVFKFGLMMAKSQLDADATTAMVYGVCTFPITLSRLSEFPNQKYAEQMIFTDRGKQVGTFILNISCLEMLKTQQKSKPPIKYNPFLSRILYQEQFSDTLQLQNNIKALQEQLALMHKDLQKQKLQEQYFQKIYYDLQEDEKQIKSQIDYLETINSKIDHRLSDRENLENLKIQVDMLGQSEEGKKILIERLEYFQGRIFRQAQENQKLVKQYERTRPQLQANLKKAQQHAQKLKGRQVQEFQLQNNKQILKAYDNLLYEFKCNEETIKSLSKMSDKSELTSQQAKLLLSQVSYEVKLAEYRTIPDKNHEKLLKKIQIQSNKKGTQNADNENQLGQEQEMVLKIKLSALRQEIEVVREKIKNIGYRK